jgi:hypothetical protein
VKKTKDVLAAHFFWPKMRCDMERYVSALPATKLSLDLTHMVLTCLFLFLVCLGGYFYGLYLSIA